MRRIAVINQKGGVGKTTTVANLGAALAARGKRVLLVDLDPQAHLTICLCPDTPDDQPTTYELLTEGAPAEKAIFEVRENMHLLPGHIDLAAVEMELVSVVGRETILRDALSDLEDDFDYLLIDCPPSLSVLTVNALAAVDDVVIPLQPHFLALQGLGKLFETILLVRRRLNAQLRVAGIVVCMYESGTRLAQEVVEDLKRFLASARDRDVPWANAIVFNSVIRRNIKLAECPSYGRTVFEYAPRSRGALDYGSLADELLSEGVEEVVSDPLPATPATHAPAVASNSIASGLETPPEELDDQPATETAPQKSVGKRSIAKPKSGAPTGTPSRKRRANKSPAQELVVAVPPSDGEDAPTPDVQVDDEIPLPPPPHNDSESSKPQPMSVVTSDSTTATIVPSEDGSPGAPADDRTPSESEADGTLDRIPRVG